jgi:hypothetical protein
MEGRYFSVVVVFKQALDRCTHALEKMALSAAQPARVQEAQASSVTCLRAK